MINENTRVPFPRHKGLKLGACPSDYLVWMAGVTDESMGEWANAAKQILADRKKNGEDSHASLEEQADALLRRAGFNPKKL